MTLKNTDRLGVSIVLCCYNSEQRIIPTLKHLVEQEGIFFPWEIIIVDNNSSDNTSQIAIDYWRANNSASELRIINEPRRGTMFARHKGILSSTFRYLLFCDDDNWFPPEYVKKAFENITRNNAIAAVGGLGTLEFEQGFVPPDWVKKFEKNYGAGPQGITDGDTTDEKGCLYTAGAILDRVWLDRLYELGFESSLKGRDGKSLVAGEDTELTYALKLIGGRLYYSSEMHFRHYMPASRMTWNYLRRMWKSFGHSDFLISPYPNYFRKRHHEALTKLILKQFIISVKFWLLASVTFFSEGNENVLKFHRYTGQLKASLFNSKIFFRNREMVGKLSAKQ